MERAYKIVVTRLSYEDGGGYLASVPELPGCMSDGQTIRAAARNARDAIRCWIEAAKELGRDIPAPMHRGKVRHNILVAKDGVRPARLAKRAA